MKKIGICLLAYDDEHINECNLLIDRLYKFRDKISVFVGTNSIEKINKNVYKIIKINESFNYNLKRITVREALKECDTIIIMDSDILFMDENIDFFELNNIEDGLHSFFLNANYKRLPKFDYTDKYQKILYECNNNKELRCIFEYFLILKISDEQKKIGFINNWDILYDKTKDVQPFSVDGLYYGAMEGLIIYVSCVLSNIKVLDYNKNVFFKVHHYRGKNINETYKEKTRLI